MSRSTDVPSMIHLVPETVTNLHSWLKRSRPDARLKSR